MYILAIAAFVIVTTEFLMVGLLPALARDLSISIATAGQLVTLFAIVVMFFGPPLTAWLAHVERKRLFMAILALFAVSNAGPELLGPGRCPHHSCACVAGVLGDGQRDSGSAGWGRALRQGRLHGLPRDFRGHAAGDSLGHGRR